MFFLKKAIGFCVQPLNFTLLLIVGSWLLAAASRKQGARRLQAAALLLIVVLSLRLPADLALRPLEHRFVPYSPEEQARTPLPRWIAVFGAGHRNTKQLPAVDRLSPAALTRLAEGLRLQRLLPGSTLILSGGAVFGEGAVAHALHAAALELGAPPERVMVEDRSRDTADEVLELRKVFGAEPFLLVTSAAHMPRSLYLARQAGLNPIPAPTHFLTAPELQLEGKLLLPGVANFEKWDSALHEYFGLLWAGLVKIAVGGADRRPQQASPVVPGS